MIATLNGNPQATLICCYSPTNCSDENDIESFYRELAYVTRQVPKHNVFMIAGDFNAHLGRIDGFKYSFHEHTNRNGSMLKDFINESNLVCLNTKYQKRTGQLWTHTTPNGQKAQLD